MYEPKVSLQAYCKMMLHAAKYPHAAVNGLLLAAAPKEHRKPSPHFDNDDDDDNEEEEEDERAAKRAVPLYLTDAIPLFHQGLGLAPMLEIALNEVDSFCSRHGLVIAGYYQANEHLESCTPDNIAYRIADKINSFFPQSVLLMIDNRRVSPLADRVAYKLFVSVGDQEWREHRNVEHVDEDLFLTTASKLLEDKISRDLVDFDNHLDDLKSDWRNLELNAFISDC